MVGHRMRIWAFFSRQLLFIPRRPSPKARNFAVSATRWIQNSSLVSPFRWRCPLRLTVETPFAERRSRAGGAPGCSAFARPCQAAMIGTGSLQELGMKVGTGKSRTDRRRIPILPIEYRIFGKKRNQEKNSRKFGENGNENG